LRLYFREVEILASISHVSYSILYRRQADLICSLTLSESRKST
jgi:hypothetical protein